jgi:predicted Zn-dependent peptidase
VTHPYFTKASVEKEQGIIGEEIRMYEDSPWSRCYRNLLEILYHDNPVRKNICGTAESIRQITPDLLYQCHEIFYNLSNMALVVCGDVSKEQVLKIADRELPTTANLATFERILPEEPATVVKKRSYDRMQVAKPLFSIGVKDPEIPADVSARLRKDAAMTLLNEILFSRSGAFYNELFEEGLLTPAFEVGYSITEDFAFNSFSGESDQPEEVFNRLLSYLEKTVSQGISEEEYQRCRRVLYADEVRAYDSTEEIANRLLSFVFEGAEMFSYLDLLRDVTGEELEELLKTAFCKDAFAMAVMEPLEQEGEEE